MNQGQSFISSIITSLIGGVLAVLILSWWLSRREAKERDNNV
tara:strand:- start:1590 stop:1715 length:126 start_codon:yes stop_codon:yes gene_type:complete